MAPISRPREYRPLTEHQKSLWRDRHTVVENIRFDNTETSDRIVSGGAIQNVLGALYTFQREDFECYPTLPMLAGRAGRSVNVVRRALEALRDLGLIIIERRRYGEYGSVSRNYYSIMWPQLNSYLADRNAYKLSRRAMAELSADPDQLPTVGDYQSPTAGDGNCPSGTEQTPTTGEYKLTENLSNEPPLGPPRDCPVSPAAGGGDLELLSTPPKEPHPAPPRDNGFAPAATVGWDKIESRLRAIGMAVPQKALGPARSAGVPIELVGALIDHWSDRRPAWDLGALCWRIEHAAAGQIATDPALWPRPSADGLAAAAKTKRDAQAAANRLDLAGERAAAEQTRRDAERLNAEWLPRLEALDATQLAALVAKLPTVLRAMFRRDGLQSPLVVESLAAAWQAEPSLFDPAAGVRP
jgi:hypothetical protein